MKNIKEIKSNWKSFIASLESAKKIVFSGMILTKDNVNWNDAFERVKTSQSNRKVYRVRSSKIEFKKPDGEITNLDRRGKIEEIKNGNRSFWLIDGYLIYYTEV